MNVLLIAQCSKNALAETRRILDQFAERRGDRTWQTAITQQGLDTLHRLLRQSARKNTAVACHWIRGKDHSELLWIVGDARQFNTRGATPTNTTARDVLRAGDENDWHTAEDIRLLASLAALFHDLGKASDAFQKKLSHHTPTADPYRHEWVSLRLFTAFVGRDSDEAWLTRLADLPANGGDEWLTRLVRDGRDLRPQGPLARLPPLAQAIGWLVVSHHRLPTAPADLPSAALRRLPDDIESAWCGSREATEKAIAACWSFKKGLPYQSRHWREHAGKAARALLRRPGLLRGNLLDDPYILHIARLGLMLADHYYSSGPSHDRYGDQVDKKRALYANTDRNSGALKQRLDEHLIGVEVNAGRILRALPRMAPQLAHIARHKALRQRSKDARYRWQDRAFDLAEGIRERAARQGFFGVDMASTGCGKTLANGRILYALADPQRGARFIIALGLRTLTLQTGDAYRERLGLGPEDLAVLVGGGALRTLHEQQRKEEEHLARNGAESSADLLPGHVHYEGSLEDGPLNRWLGANPDAQRLLDAPVLACTIDHLIPATESARGGHQIAPMLRLMSSDLVLDEPDDFSTEDLPALTRLVHWAGLLGSRVLLSSATLPPALIQGLFQAYLEGRRHYQRNRGIPGQPLDVCCAWFDEFSAEAGDHADEAGFVAAHRAFVERRLGKLAGAEVRRRAVIQPLPIAAGQSREAVCTELAAHLREQLHTLHAHHHSVDPHSGKRVSLGLIRMANIDPLVAVARALFALGGKAGTHIHLCVYHARHPLLVRSAIERRLDRWLNRKQPEALFADEAFRQRLDAAPQADQIVVVLATAVAEVGRDHDYDWGIVEPSSMRSIIQLAGRIRRHRPGPCEEPNLYLLDVNVSHLVQGEGRPAFTRPGFENSHFPLKSHHLTDLLSAQQLAVIDAASRIRERDDPQPARNLADLEHARLRDLMLGGGARQAALPVPLWWTTRAHLCGELQRRQPFRYDPLGRQRYALLPDDDDEIGFYRLETDGGTTPVGNLWQRVELRPGPRITPWGETDYTEALNTLAEALHLETADCARRFGTLDLPEKGAEQGWLYHPALGFSRVR